VLMTFVDANPYAMLSDFTPIVNWGGVVLGAPGVSVELASRDATSSTWNVLGEAVYGQAGSYIPSVQIRDISGSRVRGSSTSFNVAAAQSFLAAYASSMPGAQSNIDAIVSELMLSSLSNSVGSSEAVRAVDRIFAEGLLL
jgi:hypothetical protein